ncbi:hypothetical protein [Synechococcus sp. EJ6-Ellesmere]|uniref:hypothetical protein n=1 Tax=Synechococcus sp. EJ6-Ellesmere TaxID=2823734 RepID=UPI0020CE3ADF|nr:hypothetical protein [Synechococcus sp. EJ6-Ellesmere]
MTTWVSEVSGTKNKEPKSQDKKPVLKRLADSFPWESFRPLLDHGYDQEGKSNAGRMRIDPLILYNMLVLQQLFNLSVGLAFRLRLTSSNFR